MMELARPNQQPTETTNKHRNCVCYIVVVVVTFLFYRVLFFFFPMLVSLYVVICVVCFASYAVTSTCTVVSYTLVRSSLESQPTLNKYNSLYIYTYKYKHNCVVCTISGGSTAQQNVTYMHKMTDFIILKTLRETFGRTMRRTEPIHQNRFKMLLDFIFRIIFESLLLSFAWNTFLVRLYISSVVFSFGVGFQSAEAM